jgi:hypothetical protein
VVAQFTFRIVKSVALTTGDSSHLWLCHERLPPKSSLASFNIAILSLASVRAGKNNLYHRCTTYAIRRVGTERGRILRTKAQR